MDPERSYTRSVCSAIEGMAKAVWRANARPMVGTRVRKRGERWEVARRRDWRRGILVLVNGEENCRFYCVFMECNCNKDSGALGI